MARQKLVRVVDNLDLRPILEDHSIGRKVLDEKQRVDLIGHEWSVEEHVVLVGKVAPALPSMKVPDFTLVCLGWMLHSVV